MRKITQAIKDAFEASKKLTIGNSKVVFDAIYLHGNRIAWKTDTGVGFSLCGWNTQTTRERLHAAGVRIAQRNHLPVTLQGITDCQSNAIPSGSIIDPNKVYFLSK